jgi:hypothetical protein
MQSTAAPITARIRRLPFFIVFLHIHIFFGEHRVRLLFEQSKQFGKFVDGNAGLSDNADDIGVSSFMICSSIALIRA